MKMPTVLEKTLARGFYILARGLGVENITEKQFLVRGEPDATEQPSEHS